MANEWAITPASGVETTWDYTASTDVRDVSEVLDSVYLADTPLMNRLKFGANAKNVKIEWVSDNIGYGYVILSNGGTVASNASAVIIGTSGLGAVSLALRQINTGTILKTNNTTATAVPQTRGYMLVRNPHAGTGVGSMEVDWMSGTAPSEALSDATTLFILGNAVAEASVPRLDKTRPRSLHSNYTQIFRQDIRMSGTRTSVEMHAVPNELKHQIMLRAKEHKRQLERTYILGHKDAGSSTSTDDTRTMGGILGFMSGQSGSHVSTDTTLAESSLNGVLAAMFDKGATPNVILTGPKQARAFATFDRARVRVEQDSHVAGFYTNHFMSDLGWDLEILVSRWVPTNFLFVLDTAKVVPRALQGRKYILEKLAKVGDYQNWQLIAELTLEMRGYTEAQHGMYYLLT